jgi:lipopolysaccharide export system protein LptA
MLAGSKALAWQGADPNAREDTTGAPLIVIQADQTQVIKVGGKETRYLTGNVILRQDSIIFYGDSVIMNDQDIEASGNIIIQKGDSNNVFSNKLFYNGDTRLARLQSDVVLVDRKQQLFTEALLYDLNTEVATYATGAILTDRESYLSSKKGAYMSGTQMAFFEDSVVVSGDRFRLESDSLYFDVEKETTYFIAPTYITQDSASIYCEDGYFNLKTKDGLFAKNATYNKGDEVATADSIFYIDLTGDVRLKGEAVFQNTKQRATADQILYSERTGITYFTGGARLKDSVRNASADTIIYNNRTEVFEAIGRSVVKEEGQYLRAREIFKIPGTDITRMQGSVYWQDSASEVSLKAQVAELNDSTGYLVAFGDSTFLINVMDDDSLYLSADTLKRFVSDDSAEWTTIYAYYDVRIYKSDLQGICDSMVYSEQDSFFKMMGSPVLWSDTSQFSGDTIWVLMANDKIDRIELKGNAWVINSPDELFFNQMKGRFITAYFKDGKLDRVLADGNAQSVYYALDEENAYIGVNDVVCSRIWMYFQDQKITDVRFFEKPDGVFYPMQEANHEALKLEGFRWIRSSRPSSPEDVYAKR